MNPGNEASMILHLEYEGFDMLFTGDVEKEGEESLTDTLSYLQEKKISWEVLKTAHHGSKNSTTEAFLENVKPRIVTDIHIKILWKDLKTVARKYILHRKTVRLE